MPGVTVNSSDTLATIDLRNDPYGRITTQVMLNDQGAVPVFRRYRRQQERAFGRDGPARRRHPTGDGLVHGVTGAQMKPMATLGSLKCGVFEQRDAVVPILGDDLILPAAGMLGMDRFSGLRLEFDNAKRGK